MKAVMISIQPKQCGQIANGKQTVLVRKTKPKIDVPFKCYIYCTTAIKKTNILWGSRLRGKYYYCDDRSHNLCDAPLNKTVICEFVCDRIEGISKERLGSLSLGEFEDVQKSCLTEQQIWHYCGKRDIFYTWHISDLVIYDNQKMTSAFLVKGECNEEELCCFCEYFYRGQGWLDGSYCDESYCKIENGYKPVTKPPKSWQYVDELR